MQTIKEHKNILILSIIGLCLISLSFFYYNTKDLTFWILEHHNNNIRSIFKVLTFLGDGAFIIPLAIIIFFRNRALSALMISTYLFSGLIAQIFKRSFQYLRPSKDEDIRTILEQLALNLDEFAKYNSFPSGHTTSAFAMAFILFFNWNNPKLKWILPILAIIAGFSRVYLIQHYFADIFFGTIIGIISATIMQMTMPWWEKKLKKKS